MIGTPTRVLLVDDHTAFREAFSVVIAREPDLIVVGAVGSVADARPLLPSSDIAVIDLDLPDGNGVDLISALSVSVPAARSLVLTGGSDEETLAQAIEAGAAAIHYKTSRLSQIIAAIRHLRDGDDLLIPGELIALLRRAYLRREQTHQARRALGSLTRRERQVLEAFAAGMSDKEIAESFHVSSETVRTHVGNLLIKLNVQSRLQAVLLAIRHGAVRLH